MQDFKNLAVWNTAQLMTLEIYRTTRCFPRDEQYGLISQLKRGTVSVEANIAEGCGRGTDADFARFLQMAMGLASGVECHLLIGRDLDLLDGETHRDSNVRVVEVKRMLASLLSRLRLYK